MEQESLLVQALMGGAKLGAAWLGASLFTAGVWCVLRMRAKQVNFKSALDPRD